MHYTLPPPLPVILKTTTRHRAVQLRVHPRQRTPPFSENSRSTTQSSQGATISLRRKPARIQPSTSSTPTTAAHILVGTPKTDDEYRVILIGDSSVWGTLLTHLKTKSRGTIELAENFGVQQKHPRVQSRLSLHLSPQELMILDEALKCTSPTWSSGSPRSDRSRKAIQRSS
ncbi:MAG: hypothetical protein U0V48_10700 [Anaerolineales bacterium]